ncbi:hypothetical protein [Chitinophaga sp. Ak27]|uniref:hypothetical protein n=1 Tax=Chitinophaga sp. Ak27 TaxID=2726116 RepID=UPI00145D1C12|nr:hypothetical protein [Chitinophaga sp. Ak27]NLU91905.1 hypothetical protein [Chitinophaga sp. Ak27]
MTFIKTVHFRLLTIGGCLLLCNACQTGRLISSSAVYSNYCAPANTTIITGAPILLENTDSLISAYPGIPVHEVLMANATRTLAPLQQLQLLRTDTSLAGRVKKMELKQTIQQRCLLATTEIGSVAGELDCEGEKADQLARYLDNINSKRNTHFTVASIIVGAITTVASVVITKDAPKNAVAIGGGLLSAGLGAMTINANRKKVKLLHTRNLLQDIWYDTTASSIYSPFIRYMLHEPHFSNSGKVSLSASIRERWLQFDLRGTPSPGETRLYFGDGGVYTADDLHTRAAMLNELQSTIRSIHQDLQQLLQYLQTME